MEPVDNTPAIDSASTNVTNELDTSASPPSGPNNDQDNDDTSSELRKNPKLAHLRFRGFDENCEKAKEDTDRLVFGNMSTRDNIAAVMIL